MNDPSTQQTDWEAILEAEGMPAELTGGCPLFVDPVRAMATIPNQPDSTLPFTAGSDYDEVCRLHALLDWLPPYDRHLLERVCAGETHMTIGRGLGIAQPNATRQVQRAIVRLQGVEDIDGLGHPDDLLPALMVHCLGPGEERLWRALADLPTTWQVQALARRHQVPGTNLREAMYRLDGLTDAASLFIRLVRRLPSFRCPTHGPSLGEDQGAPHVQQNRASNDGNRRQDAENREPSESGGRTVKM